MFEHSYTIVVNDVSKFVIICLIINIRYDIHDYQFSFEMFKISLWINGVQAWVMVWCMDSLSLSPYTIQKIDVLNVNITSKHGLRNPKERSTLELT